MTGLIIHLENNEPVISTLEIAKGMDSTHESVIKLVKKYESDLCDIKAFGFKIQKSKGRKTTYCDLTEEQTAFLITLMRNSKRVVSFKKRMTMEFFKMRKTLLDLAARQQNAEWLEQREVGKITRREETDTIKLFVEYATDQGSKNASHYYSNITRMENKALFLLEQKFKNLRDILDLRQLSTLDNADAIVAKALRDGMDKNLFYKEIYQLAKKRVYAFADLRGKTVIPAIQAQEKPQITHKEAI